MKLTSTRTLAYSSFPIIVVLSLGYYFNRDTFDYLRADNLESFRCGGIASQAYISGFMWGNEDNVSILAVWIGKDWNIVSCVNEIGELRSKGVQDVITESDKLSVGHSQYDGAEFKALEEEGIELGALVFDAKEKVAFIGMNRRKDVVRNLVYTKDEIFSIEDGNVFYIDSKGSFFQLPYKTMWIQKDELDVVLQFLEPSLYGDVPLPNEITDGISLDLVVPK